MHPSTLRREQGFTLIELLVVMIIISILMAVAVPTFLSQKNTALKTQATANIKQVVNALESCAAQISSGGYIDASVDPPMNCGTADTLVGYEKSLMQLNIQAEPINPLPTEINKTQVVLSASGQGYMVQKMIQDSGKFVFFSEIHTDSGNLLKLCSTDAGITMPESAAEADQLQGVPNPETKTCKTGKW